MDLGENTFVWTNCRNEAECYVGWLIKRDASKIAWKQLSSFRCDTLTRRKYFTEITWLANFVLDVDGEELIANMVVKVCRSMMQYSLDLKPPSYEDCCFSKTVSVISDTVLGFLLLPLEFLLPSLYLIWLEGNRGRR
ncbi:hypothetical protein M5689_005594 [Euphorbia peplus]|nr:hypothetical protein M5689_005594 [Euphorbia peplus]